MCKMVYRIRSMISYTWDGNNCTGKTTPLQAVKDLFGNDPTFSLMISMVRKNLTFLLEGTDPDHSLVSNVVKKRMPRKQVDFVQLENWQISQGYREMKSSTQNKEEEKDSFFLTAASSHFQKPVK